MSLLLDRTVLLISRQPELRRQLRVTLKRHGALLVECRYPEEGELGIPQPPNLILLDLSTHDSSVAAATEFIRAHSERPLIALSATHDEQQRLAALAAGADDYIVLPVGSSELLACMRAALERMPRWATQKQPEVFRAGALEVDFVLREVRLRGKPIHLTPTEYKLLRVLIESAGKLVTHERLLREIWGPAAVQHVRHLRVHMKQLRRKFELAPPFAPYLIAELGLGYRLWVPA